MKVVSNLIAIVIIIGVGYGIYIVFSIFFNFLSSTSNPTMATILTGGIAAAASVGSISISNLLQRRAELDRQLREKKIPLYVDLITFLFRLMELGKQAPLSTEEMMKEFLKHTTLIIAWGGDGVLRKFSEFRHTLISQHTIGGLEVSRLAQILENLLLEIRLDLGHKNQKFVRKDVLRLFINDIDSHI